MSNVLVIDGSPLMRNSVAELLRRAGHVVRDACDAEEAKEMLSGSAVDVVVLDPDLPRGDGLELFRSIRSDQSLRILPVIVYTTSNDKSFLKDARRLKAARVFHKAQISIDEIQKSIQELTARPARIAARRTPVRKTSSRA